jgi:catechol-2,3-dioxygenase
MKGRSGDLVTDITETPEATEASVRQPAAPVGKLGFVGFRTPDVEAFVDYYTESLGFEVVDRSASHAYLATGADHHCIAVESGDAAARTVVGLRLRADLDDVAERLRHAGIAVETQTDSAPGIASSLVIEEPGGTPLVLYREMAQRPVSAPPILRPVKLGHVASFTSDLPTIQRYYQEVLGFRWSDTLGDFFVFLRCGPDHHAVNFMESQRRTGLHHIAYEARDITHLKMLLDHLASRGHRLEWGPGRHGAGHNIFTYHRDPDGNLVELFTELDLIFDETTPHFEPRPWHEEFPQGPRVWEPSEVAANSWGPINPEMLDR